jgi:hypothetical protein
VSVAPIKISTALLCGKPFTHSRFVSSRDRLSKVIAQRWRQLPVEGRAFYRDVAKADQAEYDRFAPPEQRQRQATDKPSKVTDENFL